MNIINFNVRESSVGEDVKRKECIYIVGGNLYWCSHYGKQYGDFFKD